MLDLGARARRAWNFRITQMQEVWSRRRQTRFTRDLSISEAASEYPDRNTMHAYMHHYFHYLCPPALRDHRAYFRQGNRGFGEDALHAMWWCLFREFRPVHCLEIGVYRGQVISLWALIGRELGLQVNVTGLSPFDNAGDSVSSYATGIDYMTDTVEHFRHFGLPKPTLVRSLSTTREARECISAKEWDLIYIDGSHEYETVLSDYKVSSRVLRPEGLLVIDDSSLRFPYNPPRFSFAGHPGPSKVAFENAQGELRLVAGVGHNNIFANRPQRGLRDSCPPPQSPRP